jgi:orotate phosphoribosyltransferase
MSHVITSYLQSALCVEKLERTVDAVVEKLLPHADKFDGIAFRGMSGALVAPMVAVKMKKKMLMVRKPDEKNHSYMTVEGDFSTQKYIIVDDLVCSGDTIQATFNSIKSTFEGRAQEISCIGVICYQDNNAHWYEKYGIRYTTIQNIIRHPDPLVLSLYIL